MKTYKLSEFAKLVGVSTKTLQRWDNDGKLKAFRTPTDRRFYTEQQLMKFANGNQDITNDLKKNGLME